LSAKSLLQHLYSRPIVDIGDVAQVLEVNFSTAARLVDDFTRLKILTEITGYKRNRLFTFEDYLKLFR